MRAKRTPKPRKNTDFSIWNTGHSTIDDPCQPGVAPVRRVLVAAGFADQPMHQLATIYGPMQIHLPCGGCNTGHTVAIPDLLQRQPCLADVLLGDLRARTTCRSFAEKPEPRSRRRRAAS